jgi:hypothetical protein
MNEEQALREQYEEQGASDAPEYPDESSEGGYGRYISLFLGIAFVFLLAMVWRYYGLIGTFDSSTGMLNIYNEANVELDTEAIETATQKLRENFGLNIDIYIVQTTATTEAFSSLAGHNLRREMDSLSANNLVIVIGIDDRYSEISWGANLKRLEGSAIRGEILNPRLNEEDYTGALVNSFNATLERLSDADLAFQELFRGFGNYLDEIIILGILVIALVIGVAVRLSNPSMGNSASWYNSADSSDSSWDNSSSSSSWSSGGTGDSGGSSDSGGGSDSGSWSD